MNGIQYVQHIGYFGGVHSVVIPEVGFQANATGESVAAARTLYLFARWFQETTAARVLLILLEGSGELEGNHLEVEILLPFGCLT